MSTCASCSHPAGWHDPYGTGQAPCEWLGVTKLGAPVCTCRGLVVAS